MGILIKLYNYLFLGLSRIKYLLSNFYSFLFAKIFFILFLVINIFLWGFSFYIFNNISQDRIILHYNVDLGVNLIGNKQEIFLIPILSLAIIILNKIILLFMLNRKNVHFKFASYFSSSFLLLTQIFLFIIILLIYSINFK